MWTTLFLVASLGAIWFILRREAVVRLNMPYVQFDGDNSDARYISETKSLMERGYYNVRITLYQDIGYLAHLCSSTSKVAKRLPSGIRWMKNIHKSSCL